MLFCFFISFICYSYFILYILSLLTNFTNITFYLVILSWIGRFEWSVCRSASPSSFEKSVLHRSWLHSLKMFFFFFSFFSYIKNINDEKFGCNSYRQYTLFKYTDVMWCNWWRFLKFWWMQIFFFLMCSCIVTACDQTSRFPDTATSLVYVSAPFVIAITC